ncbi:uncharacterized protein LOC116338323 [Contarinia nasturtii]|uniref:uncharacterized protein LOC116338323 n=1 Tax=Contarinia nasturtii TaxID=265458 RepID=UPI0012D3A378|nr:uncharacterized protein LOC116338323 [Contarinia nasturtii]
MNFKFCKWQLFGIVVFLVLESISVFGDELNDFQQIDGPVQSDSSRALPTISTNPSGGLPIPSPGEKPTLYLGTFQILAMPFSPDNIPPNFGSIPSIAQPSKKD